MRAITFEEFGGPDVLVEREIARPKPGARQVQVRVKATSVNPLDIQTRRGDYASTTSLPGRLGVDVAGIVEAIGQSVSTFKPGDEVFYVPKLLENDGGYAEYHVEDEEIVAPKPAGLSFEQAAALPLAAGTAWECLIERGNLRAGERVLVHGGAGGVGVFAVQIARAAGAFVAATGRQEHTEFLKNLGASTVIDYRSQDLVTQLAETTGGQGFDVILDTVGQDTIARSLELLAQFGRIVSIVDQSVPQNLLSGWEKNASVHFVFTTQSKKRLERLKDLVERGLLKPEIERTLPLSQAAEAHRLVETGQRRGKIILCVGTSDRSANG